MTLSREAYDFVTYVEGQYFLHGACPSRKTAAHQFGVTETRVDTLYKKPEVVEALRERGIFLKGASGGTGDGVFSAEQVAYVNMILDPTNGKTRKAILRDLGLHPNTVQAWTRDPAFQSYLRERAEALIPDAVPEAHIALMNNVMRGDMSAIKLVYEMNGRWSSKTVGELNVEFLMQKIIEILTSELSDNPVVLERIGTKLANLAGGSPVSSQAVGASNSRPILELTE